MFLHKRIHLALLMLLIGGNVFSQAFSEAWNISLDNSYRSVRSEWGDLDNDGLLDIVMLIRDDSGLSHLSIIKGDTLNTPIESDTLKFRVIDSDRFFLADFNSDNMIDIIIPGTEPSGPAHIYLNKGDLKFEDVTTTIPSFSKMVFADIDNDAAPEWIVSHVKDGDDLVTTFKMITGNWSPVDTLHIKAETLEVFDADGDGFRDIFVSGQVTPDSLFTGFLINQGQFNFTTAHRIDAKATGSMGDVNHDGFFDIILKGSDPDGNAINKIYLSGNGSYTVRDSLFQSITPHAFIADFNSDGKADINFWSKNPGGDSISLIRTGTLTYDTISLNHIVQEKFGDADHDGDLDALHVRNTTPLSLVLFNNNAQANTAPAVPQEVKAFMFFDHIFMTWQRSLDDHTPSRALTYDIYLEGVNSGEFDVTNEKRLKVNHGNNGANDFLLIKVPEQATLQFALESVDNSFHGGGEGICLGGVESCSAMKLDSITMCSKETRLLKAPETSSWYSFSSGYLFTGKEFTLTATVPDVIFYFTPSNPNCANLKAWYINVKDTTRQEFFSRFECEGAEIQLEVEPEWTNVAWESVLRGSLGTSHAIDYQVTVDDKVSAFLSLGTGCNVDREFTIKVSKPDIKISAENTFVLAGKSVQLHATGGEHYLWNAASSIDNINSPDPFVTPLETTNYTVTGFDSIGCTEQETIRINVEKNGFIPSLFTPNNDGNNDYLRIYGIVDAEEVSFEIFNRSGGKVYSASSISELIHGWDGAAHGIKQPGGVYFWKVKGRLFSGEKVQFNGKETGSVVLIR